MTYDESRDPPATQYAQTLRALNDRLIAVQRSLCILDAVAWGTGVEAAFHAAGGRELPQVDPGFYAARPLRFPIDPVRQSLRDIEAESLRRLGFADPAGMLLRRRSEECREVIDLLTARGTAQFSKRARRLYGTDTTPHEARAVTALLASLSPGMPTRPENHRKVFDAAEAVAILSDRLAPLLPDGLPVRVKVCDRLLADAAAGCACVKLRRAARFSVMDLALLEVHEGWVHVGTTVNGQRQPLLTCLAKGPPSTAMAQEGLAVLCELLAGVCHPARLARLWRRLQAVRMAEAGADFLQVYQYFLQFTDDPHHSYHQAARVFRGSLPSAGPFPKDVCYAHGLYRILVRLTQWTARGGASDASWVFAGKFTLDELPSIDRLRDANLLAQPAVVPPPFQDRNGLARRLREMCPAAPATVTSPLSQANRLL